MPGLRPLPSGTNRSDLPAEMLGATNNRDADGHTFIRIFMATERNDQYGVRVQSLQSGFVSL